MRERTPDRARAKRSSYRARRTAVMIGTLIVTLLSAVILAGVFGGLLPASWGTLLLMIVFAVAALLNAVLWRCPSCRAHLGKLFIGLRGPRFCPGCGVPLDEGGDAV